MSNDNEWLIMTYYCPTYGAENRLNQIDLNPSELRKFKRIHNDKKKIDN
tara:strand:+ start:880 stop:1026 length:147 start_codon:yes stop_codon:yes gene_type:complete